ncbi:hypothetical protein STRIP9103_07369 [Streptomyces ipomoeae 91-03]|uniref:Uncharacterized protein n=1 Tax=Streptomyces ipomoeae 91-03 TaxID=698759 RepID=L1KLS5_9ACTN|nr:hypothetical protein STRIP9103_07369 [Streptomyces ipomoeae 91-03]
MLPRRRADEPSAGRSAGCAASSGPVVRERRHLRHRRRRALFSPKAARSLITPPTGAVQCDEVVRSRHLCEVCGRQQLLAGGEQL